MRSIWKGHIRFLLVAIPVRIYNAIETAEKIQFNQLHREDFGPIGYDKRCKKCGQVVTNEQITKGYQYEPDRYAIVEPEDIAKVKIKTTKAVDIIGFVDSSEIPTTFYDSPYYAGPDGPVSEKPVPELEGATKLDKNELKLATTLVEQMVTTLSEIDTVDQYNQALRKLIESKIKGKKVVEFEVEELPRLDIMSALKKSLQQSSRKPMVKATTPAAKKKSLTLVKPTAKPKAIKRRKAS